MRWVCRWCLASSSVVPVGTVIRFSLVITSRTLVPARSSTKRTSRLVRMPTSFFSRTTGRPDTRYACMRSSACSTVSSGSTVMGSMIMPLSDFLTFSISSFWRSMLIFLCTMPMPPARAMEMAIADSVTVSIAAETSGIFREMDGVSQAVTSTTSGVTSE